MPESLQGPRPSGSAVGKLIPEKRNIHVQEAVNGYVLNLGYGEIQIAQTKDEALTIIGEYLDRPKE